MADNSDRNDDGPQGSWGLDELTKLVGAMDDLAHLHRQSFDEIRSDLVRMMNHTNQCEAQVQSCRSVGMA